MDTVRRSIFRALTKFAAAFLATLLLVAWLSPLGYASNQAICVPITSDNWAFDQKSQVVAAESNLIWKNLSNTSGSSKGDPRLSSIGYPNSQSTEFSYLPNVGDQLLQQIKNLDSTPALLSQFNYAYNPAGEITQWLKKQNSSTKHQGLGYDLASQLVTAVTDSGSILKTYISGTAHTGDAVSVTAYDASLTGSSGQETASYTVQSGDSLSAIASGLASSINSNMSNISVTASATGSVVTINTSPSYCTQFSSAVTGTGATTTISMSGASPKPNFEKQLYYAFDCVGNLTGVQGDSTGSFPSGLTMDAVKFSYNNLNQLTGISAGGPVRFQGSTTNPIKSAVVNPTQTATIGGTITVGDILWLSVHDKALATAVNISYTVQSGDTTTSIATALKNAVNANSTLSTLGVTATSSAAVITISSSSSNPTFITKTLGSGATETITLGGSRATRAEISPSTAFSANPELASGANTASVTALSGGGTPATNTYPISINSVSSKTLTYDANGNVTGDGTNSYSWDAGNRPIRVTYPGTNNFTEFTLDGLGRPVKIVETTSGSVTSTKQLIWCGSRICEERDASGSLVTQFFPLGYKTGGNSFYYNLDHLGSVREVTNSSGAIVAQVSYGPWGEPTLLQGSALPEFGFANMYYHVRSGLNLTLYRAYSSSLGRWLSRDPLGESTGLNLYSYVSNNPIRFIDPLGLEGEFQNRTPVLPILQDIFEFQRGFLDYRPFSRLSTDDPISGAYKAGESTAYYGRALGGLAPAGGPKGPMAPPTPKACPARQPGDPLRDWPGRDVGLDPYDPIDYSIWNPAPRPGHARVIGGDAGVPEGYDPRPNPLLNWDNYSFWKDVPRPPDPNLN